MISFSKWLENRFLQDKSLDWMDSKVSDKSIDKTGRLLVKKSKESKPKKLDQNQKPPNNPPPGTYNNKCRCKCFPCMVLKSCKSCNCKNCKCEGCECSLNNKNYNSNKYKKNYK